MKKVCKALMISSMMILGSAACGGDDSDSDVESFKIKDGSISIISSAKKQCLSSILVNQHLKDGDVPGRWPYKVMIFNVCGKPQLTSSVINLNNGVDADDNSIRYIVLESAKSNTMQFLSTGGKVEFSEVSENLVKGTITDATFKDITCIEDEEEDETSCEFNQNAKEIVMDTISINISEDDISFIDCEKEDLDFMSILMCGTLGEDEEEE